jgi:NAD(P)H dehydrogenase (quinone)
MKRSYPMPSVVLTGIAGIQQSVIAAAFRAAGWSVSGTRRTAAPGVRLANLETGEGLAAAFKGADVVVFTVPQDHRPGVIEHMAAAVTKAAAEAGVGRLVLNPAGRIDPTSTAALFATLRAMRDTVLSGATPVNVVEPTVFMDNLLAPWAMPGIVAGTLAYPMQPDTAVAWVSHRTLADAIVAAATMADTGQTFRIGSAPVTALQIAAALAAHLGHPVAYAPIPLAGFAAGLNASFGPPAGDRIAELYANLEANPKVMIDGTADLARLGVAPESIADFIARSRWMVPA